ncbi:MAG: hypothetical protein AB7O66_05150 [Limisphaerales bacterium]
MIPASRRILSVAGQTVRTALRLRVFVLAAVAILATLLGLPFLIRHDGTARMLAEVTLTYSLVAIVVLLGGLSLWLSCSTIAGEIASGELSLVSLKPVRRWQLWLGKWLGVLTIDAILLGCGLTLVGTLLLVRSRQLPPDQQQEFRSAILVARASHREPPVDLRSDIELLVGRRMQQEGSEGLDPKLVREQMAAYARARHETVGPSFRRVWAVSVKPPHSESSPRTLHLRIRFHAANLSRQVTYPTVWIVGDTLSGRYERFEKHLTAGVTHEFPISESLVSPRGELIVECENRGDASLLFRFEDGLEVLQPAGGFFPNLLRAGAILLCWLALITAAGLAASSLFSVPTAWVVCVGLLYMGCSGETLTEIVEEGTVFGVEHGHGDVEPHLIDRVAVPAFGAIHRVVDGILSVSPVTRLGTGRAIGWDQLARAFVDVVLVGAGTFSAISMLVFQRRQLGLPSTTP